MNKVFKVIWSEARNAYVVVSEMAKSHGTKSCSTKKLLAMLIATGVMTCASMAPAMADNPAPNDLNVTIGKGAHVSVWNGVSGQTISGDIAVGPNAHAWNGEYTYENGKGFVAPRIGTKEYMMDFGQGAVEAVSDPWILFLKKTNYKVADGSKIAGSIAIGKNTVARTGSVMLGDHSYTGNLGDIEINPANAMTYNDGIYSTTLGAGAYNSGSLAAVTGALSIASGKDTKNTGATIYGSMNSIESATSDNIYSGVASSVLGFANRTQNANAALIWGTGNEVTNSVEDIGINTNWNNVSVADAQKKAIEAMQSSKYAGGSVMAIGGGNKADYAKYSQLTGVQNKVTGTEAKAAKYDFVNGYQNTVSNASDVTVIGIKNEVKADGNKVIGDNHKVSGKDNVIFGSADQLTETTVNNAVVLGHNAKVTGEGGVALGAGSVANRANAVSVGSTGANRQIINVAAGTEDTDAVNLSQLNAVKETANKGWNLSTNGGEASKVAPDATVDFSGDKNISVSHDGTKVQVELNKNIDVNYVQTNALNAKYNLSVGTANENGTVPFLVNSTGAFYAANNNFSVDKDGKVIATAGEIGNVVLKKGVYTGNSALRDGELYVGDASGNYSQITPKSAKLGQVTIDEKGNMAGVNSIQTNALNSKYNLSVGTMAENGIMPFLVNSTGAFYAANNNFSVDKDGKVIATAGEIGNVVLKKGVYTGNSALRDGELYVGDASGNYSQITTTGAKLGQVTIAADGKISGVAAGEVSSTSTDAVNGSQLHAVATEAGKHTTLSNGKNTTVESTVKDGQTDYKVNVAGDLTDITSVANGDSKINLNKDSIIISNGNKYFAITNSGIGMSYIGADYSAKSIMLGENGTTISGGLNVAGSKITGVAAGEVSSTSTDAVNGSQLHAVATEAGKHTTLSNGKNTTVESTVKDGQTDYKVNVAGDLTDITSVANGDSKINLNKDSIIISNGNKYFAITNSGIGMSYIGADYSAKSIMLGENGTTISGGLNVAGSKIIGVAAGEVSKTSTDAINGSQLHQTNENVAALDKRVTQNEADIAQNKADIAQNKADIAQNKADIAQNKADIAQNKADIAQNKADIAQNKADIAQNKADIAQNKADIATNKANIEKNANDIATNKQNIDKLNTRVDGVEKLAKQHTTVTAGDNIAVTETTNKDGGKEYNVALKNNIDLGDKGSVTTGQTEMNNDGLKVGDKVSVTATAVTAGKTSISDEGVKVGDKTYINDKGLNANGQNITNVADGKVEKDSKDAINGGQLHQAKADINNRIDGVENQVVSNTNRINQLGSRVNKVGAGAAALAALHPMDFDPDDKLTFSAGYGNYGGENAAAIGAYYRPDEKVMFSVAGTVGNGENMVNAGVSFALDRTNHVSNSRTALAREVIDLRGQLAVMGAKMAKMEKAFGMLDETKTKLFPDVPANHWAYEYIAKLAGNGYIEGYPDGNFGGDRLMTRYEFAAMLYRAIEKGAALEEKIIKEFEPELGRIRVDRISGEDGDRDKIERVRVNDTKGERDHYGNKLAK